MRRRSRYGAALTGLVLGLSGCSTVPTSGDATIVEAAPPAKGPGAGVRPVIRRAGTPVSASFTPTEVVEGFLDAEQDTSTEGTLLAQGYLTSAPVWDAAGETLVYTSIAQVTELPTGEATSREVRVTYSLLARITEDGEYRPDVREHSHVFELMKTGDGWRIANLPHGRRISNDDLNRVFRRVVPWFYATRDYDTLIPDPVYLLTQNSTVRETVRRLISGPSPVLGDFLPPSLFPPDTTLLTASEPQNGIATVSFSDELELSTEVNRARIVGQLVWTLTALDSRIEAVVVNVSDRPFDFGEDDQAGEPQRQDAWSGYDPDLGYSRRTSYFTLGGTLGRYRRSSVVQSARSLGPGTGEPAVNADDTQVAVVAQGDVLQELRVGPVATGPLATQLQSKRLTRPSWGTEQDGVWVVTQEGDEPPKVHSVPGNAQDSRAIDASELGTRVHAFEVAPDGLRVAAIVERAGRRSLEIGYIDRAAFNGAALRVGGFRPVVDRANVTALSVSWLDSGKLAFIGHRGQENPSAFTVLVDGTSLVESVGSREVLELNSPLPAPPAQLLPLAVRHESARRGDNNTGDDMLIVIDGRTAYTNVGTGWRLAPGRSRNE